ncbi:hypothetical protein TNCV_4016511 [Trichonephila clavipes]|nr:hypothetical protein TNCV_4016511 [Trichonephila clavipes]
MLNQALPEQDLTFDDYVLVDTGIALWGALSDAEIVALDHNNTESDEDESEELTPFHEYCIENWLKWVRAACPVDKKSLIRKNYLEDIEIEKGNESEKSQIQPDKTDLMNQCVQIVSFETKDISDIQKDIVIDVIPSPVSSVQQRKYKSPTVRNQELNIKDLVVVSENLKIKNSPVINKFKGW